MKIFAAVLLLCASMALARPSQPGGWLVPQLNGSFEWVSEEEWNAEVPSFNAEQGPEFEINANGYIGFYLYTANNPYRYPEQIDITDPRSIGRSHFNNAHQTTILSHGWQNNHLSDINVLLCNAILSKGPHNVIVVDWSYYSENLSYRRSAGYVKIAGQQTANLIDYLNEHGGLSFSNLRLIGHSLGAHVAGIAGKNVKRGRIATIIGLDPALPLFKYDVTSERLYVTDANYVESIQTCGGLLGFLEPIGQKAFYPNGGKSQPGCGRDLTGSCAHSRSYEYYAESIVRNDFPSIRCHYYADATNNNCGDQLSNIRLGAASNSGSEDGIFYTPVNDKSPFGRG